MMRGVVCSFLLLCASSLSAQEIAVYRARVTPSLWADRTQNVGVSLAWTGAPSSRSRIQLGARIAFNEAKDSSFYVCAACLTTEGPAPLVYAHRQTIQLVGLVVPYARRSTRLDLGLGVARHAFSGHVEKTLMSAVGTIGLSQRLIPRTPIWATVGADVHVAREPYRVFPNDVLSADIPEQVVRLGLMLRR